MRTATIAFIVILLSCGCTYTAERPTTYESLGVARLSEPPRDRPYTSLGEHTWGFYQPGWSEPRIADVWNRLSEKVTALGGNACIVLYDDVTGMSARTIEVTCKVIRVD